VHSPQGDLRTLTRRPATAPRPCGPEIFKEKAWIVDASEASAHKDVAGGRLNLPAAGRPDEHHPTHTRAGCGFRGRRLPMLPSHRLLLQSGRLSQRIKPETRCPLLSPLGRVAHRPARLVCLPAESLVVPLPVRCGLRTVQMTGHRLDGPAKSAGGLKGRISLAVSMREMPIIRFRQRLSSPEVRLSAR
jgi:hypothetical protein